MINIDNLNRGIEIFKGRINWPRDFHNGFYKLLSEKFNEYFLGIQEPELYLRYIVDNLAIWKALRGRHGFTKQFLMTKLIEENDLLMGFITVLRNRNLSIDIANYEDIQNIFNFAKGLKRAESPVFASKFCHFLFPNLFVVVDNELSQARTDYRTYWEFCKQSWSLCPNKEILKEILNEEIQNNLIPNYPYSCKIAELCYIGKGN